MRKISGKFIAPSSPVLLDTERIVVDPSKVVKLFADNFRDVYRKDSTSVSGHRRRYLESSDIYFNSNKGESYNVPFYPSELLLGLTQCQDSPGPDDIP